MVYIPEYVLGALVRAAPAQPERAAAQGPAAVHPRRHGGQRAVAAALVRGQRAPARRPDRRIGAAAASEHGTRARGHPAGAPQRRWSARSSRSRSARSRTAATASPGTTAAWSSSGTPCRASGSGCGSPAAGRATGSCSATPSRCSSRRRTAAPRRARSAGPGQCGGCDWQHVDLDYQRELKAAVVREQLHRLAGLDLDVARRARARRHRRPALAHRGSSSPSTPRAGPDCGATTATTSSRSTTASSPPSAVAASGVLDREWPGADSVDVVDPGAGAPAHVVPVRHGRASAGDVVQRVDTASWAGEFRLSARGFWQVHPGAAATFVDAVLQQLAPAAGERALDLYAGVGLFARALADAVGPGGRGPRGRVRPAGGARRGAQRRRPAPGRGAARARSTGRCGRWCARASRPTWWCSTRRAPVPAGR